MKKIIGLGFGLLFFVSNVSAIDLGVGARAGVNGIGLDLSVGLTKTLNLRVVATNVDIEGEDETITVGDDVEGDLDAELDFNYGASALLLDWHLFNGGFHLTAGMFKNNGAADLTGTLQDTIVVDGDTIAPGDLVDGGINGEISLGDSYQPYVGIGWGRRAGGDGGLSVTFDLGIAIVEPDVDFEATVIPGVNFANQAELDEAIANAESSAEDDLDDLELWPVLAIGVNYAF